MKFKLKEDVTKKLRVHDVIRFRGEGDRVALMGSETKITHIAKDYICIDVFDGGSSHQFSIKPNQVTHVERCLKIEVEKR